MNTSSIEQHLYLKTLFRFSGSSTYKGVESQESELDDITFGEKLLPSKSGNSSVL